jgi:hypothetical protein
MIKVLLGFFLGMVVAGAAAYAWTDKGLSKLVYRINVGFHGN